LNDSAWKIRWGWLQFELLDSNGHPSNFLGRYLTLNKGSFCQHFIRRLDFDSKKKQTSTNTFQLSWHRKRKGKEKPLYISCIWVSFYLRREYRIQDCVHTVEHGESCLHWIACRPWPWFRFHGTCHGTGHCSCPYGYLYSTSSANFGVASHRLKRFSLNLWPGSS